MHQQQRPPDVAHMVLLIGGFAILVMAVLAFVTRHHREPEPAPPPVTQPR